MQQVELLPVVADVLINPSEHDAGQGASTQVDHAQEEEQVCVPPLPQDWVALGVHTPSPEQAPQAVVVQVPLLPSQVTVLVCVPQLPQLSLATGLEAAGQVCPVQAPHGPQEPPSQLAVQVLVCVPPVPHARLAGRVWVGATHAPFTTHKLHSHAQVFGLRANPAAHGVVPLQLQTSDAPPIILPKLAQISPVQPSPVFSYPLEKLNFIVPFS